MKGEMRNMSKMYYIATASIAVSAEYNKNADADFIEVEHEHMDAIAE